MQQGGQISLPSVLAHQQPPDKFFFLFLSSLKKTLCQIHCFKKAFQLVSNRSKTDSWCPSGSSADTQAIQANRCISKTITGMPFWILSRCTKRPNTISSMNMWNQFWTWHASSNQATLQHANGNLVIKTYTKSWVWGERQKRISTLNLGQKEGLCSFSRVGQEQVPKRKREEIRAEGRSLFPWITEVHLLLYICQINLTDFYKKDLQKEQ